MLRPSQDAPRTRPRRSGLAVRARIVAVLTALVFVSLVASGAIMYSVDSSRVERQAHLAAEQEIAEFQRLEAGRIDQRTARPFSSAEELLSVFLQRSVSSEAEVIVAWLDDRARYVSAGPYRELATDPAFEEAVRGLIPTGRDTTVDTSLGPVLVTVQPVEESTGATGGLVVATVLDAAKADLRELIRDYAIIGALSMVAIVGLAAWQAGRLLAPIRELSQTARRISDTDLSARLVVAGNDDLTDLSETVNEMLDRLEVAFAQQRRFLDDAGHELKTPLTVIRGHLELLDSAEPDEVDETRDLVLDEVDRMSRLVGDLILLAKARRPDFLQVGPVDVADLTRSVLDKVRALRERQWVLDDTTDVTAVLDEQRITQALLALAQNSFKHTRTDDEVAIGSAVVGQSLLLWVRDTGPGIDPNHRAHVLERFGRSAVAPGDEGFGLGLSIVTAIGTAHGGRLDLTDARPPESRTDNRPGLRATITIPLRREAAWPIS